VSPSAVSHIASLGVAPFPVPALAPSASSSAVCRTDSPSSGPRVELPDQGPRSGHDLEACAESDPRSSHGIESPATSLRTSPSNIANTNEPTSNIPSARLSPSMLPLPKPSLIIVPSSAPFQDASEQSARLALRNLIDTAAGDYQSAANWADIVTQCQDARGDLHPGVGDLPHRAAHMLDQLRFHGAPDGMKTEPWDDQKKYEALQRGSHQSALQNEGFFCEECVDLILKGQWVLLPADMVLQEPNLRISPLGVVPQRERRTRTICEYSFFLVNLDTIPLAPAESMHFGCALWRILSTVNHADPLLGPVFLS
jgi:hypothetical protein